MWFRASIWLSVSLTFTAVVLELSEHRGRLLLYPQFDDITYFDDALSRLQTLQTQGFRSFFHAWRAAPPHSAASTLIAMAAFALGGPSDVAPYLANGLLVLLAMILVDAITRGLSLIEKFACQVLLLSVRWMSMAVTVYRPDFLAALFLSAGIVLALSRPFVFGRRPRVMFIGACFGAAIATKPPVFLAVVAAFVITLVSVIFTDAVAWRSRQVVQSKKRPPSIWWRRSVVTLIYCIAGFALVAGPPFVSDWRGIVAYVYDNTYGINRPVWEVHTTFAQSLAYYITGPGAGLTLRRQVPLLAALCAVAVTFYGVRRKPVELARLGSATAVLGVLYIINVVNPTKHEYMALTFQVPLTFVVILWMRAGAVHLRFRCSAPVEGRWSHKHKSAIVLAGVAAIAAAAFQGPERYSGQALADAAQRKSVVRTVVADVLDALAATGRESAARKVFLTGAGDLNAWLLDFRARQHGVTGVWFENDEFDVAAAAVVERAQSADFILVGDDRCRLFSKRLPSSRIQNEVRVQLLSLKTTLAQPRFRTLATVAFGSVPKAITILGHADGQLRTGSAPSNASLSLLRPAG